MNIEGEELNRAKAFEIIKYVPHPKQTYFHDSEARFRTLLCGRRWGKTHAAAAEAIAGMMTEMQRGWVVAPTYELAKKVFREVFWMVNKHMPELIKYASESAQYIKLTNGSEIWGKSADNPVSLIGEGLNFLIMDEAARISEIVWQEALRPTLTDRKGKAVFITTPRGNTWVYKMYLKGQDKNEKDYESWTFRTIDNPFIDPEEIAEAKRSLPESVFRQEYEAAIVDDVGGVFRRVEACIKGSIEDPVATNSYVVGVDLAKYEDFTVMIVMDKIRKQVVYFDRFNRADWTVQKQRIVSIAEKYNKAEVIIDSTGIGDPIYDDLKRGDLRIEGFKISSNQVKNNLINELIIAIEKVEIFYPDIPELLNELRIFEYEMTPSRNIRYNAPAGFHDDCVIALALAVHKIATTGFYDIIGAGNEPRFREQDPNQGDFIDWGKY